MGIDGSLVVEVAGLSKRYGPVPAVKGISFTVRRGEVFALLGPNGAGKTTTIEILEGHRRPTAGHVRVLGVDPARGGRRFRERIGIVLQSGGIDSELTVGEILGLYGRLYPRRREVTEVVELVGLADKQRSRIRHLSGGQRRRLDLALALVGDPEVLFLDEPTTGFDPNARRQAWDMVTGLRRLGKTVLLTSHYMDEVQQLADRIVIMRSGLVAAESTPQALGGRDVGTATIVFRAPSADWQDELPQGPWQVTVHDGEFSVRTDHVTEALAALTGWALAHGEQLVGLTVTRPSLEEAYLRITESDEPQAVEP